MPVEECVCVRMLLFISLNEWMEVGCKAICPSQTPNLSLSLCLQPGPTHTQSWLRWTGLLSDITFARCIKSLLVWFQLYQWQWQYGLTKFSYVLVGLSGNQIKNPDLIYHSLSLSFMTGRHTLLSMRAAPVLKCPIEFAEVDLSPTIPSRITLSHGSRQGWAPHSSCPPHERGLSFLGSVRRPQPHILLRVGKVLHDARGNDLVCEDWTVDGDCDDVDRDADATAEDVANS